METIKFVPGDKAYSFIKYTFPEYKKRKLYVSIHDTSEHDITTHPGGWDAGSIDEDYIISYNPEGHFLIQKAHQATRFNFDRDLGFPKVLIDNNQCMVTNGTADSKPSTIHVTCTRSFYNAFIKEV